MNRGPPTSQRERRKNCLHCQKCDREASKRHGISFIHVKYNSYFSLCGSSSKKKIVIFSSREKMKANTTTCAAAGSINYALSRHIRCLLTQVSPMFMLTSAQLCVARKTNVLLSFNYWIYWSWSAMVSFLVSVIIGKRCENQSLCSYFYKFSSGNLKIMHEAEMLLQ